MDSRDISVVFFGSGPVAAKSLGLLAKNFTIEAVITKPKPEGHKGDFPVLSLYERSGDSLGKLYTVTNKQELSDLVAREKFESRVGVVIDFGIIIAQDVIDSFDLGIVNSHFSLLPEWRGADPITFSVLSGQKKTGVSLMLIDAKLDEGLLLAWGEHELNGGETTPSLTDYLIKLSDALLRDVLPKYVGGEFKPFPQSDKVKPTYSRKLVKEDGVLDWNKPAVVLEREIRAFAGWPQSRTKLGEHDVIITAAHAVEALEDAEPGTVWHDAKELHVHTRDGVLVIDRLKPAGKGEMDVRAFLAGYRV